MLAIVSITACLFFSLIRSGAIIDAIEHSGPTASGHSHSAISLATLDIDHDDHDVAAHQESEGDNPSDNDGDGSSNDAVHHHHHQDGSAGILSIGSPLTGDALVQFMANGSPEPRFSVFGPHDRLKRPPKASQILA
ncbi:MAG: hypothetical protein EOP21_08160 [Hyphomicrobiales bacterium]|nr:MAG: hypothetical protein EOP21_08160 [Hyphomicrobiales bacterium]